MHNHTLRRSGSSAAYLQPKPTEINTFDATADGTVGDDDLGTDAGQRLWGEIQGHKSVGGTIPLSSPPS
jgi:hypothetical protein